MGGITGAVGKIGTLAFCGKFTAGAPQHSFLTSCRCVVLNVVRTVIIPVEKISDWPSFHDVFQRVLGFPDFYGRNMNAWIDCMTSVDTPADRMSTVTVQPGEILVLRIDDPFDFRRRCSEQYDALMECTAFVNFRRVEIGEPPPLALLLVGKS
jgi:hypothetical protein